MAVRIQASLPTSTPRLYDAIGAGRVLEQAGRPRVRVEVVARRDLATGVAAGVPVALSA